MLSQMHYQRAAIEEIRLGVDFSKMAELQRQDPETKGLQDVGHGIKMGGNRSTQRPAKAAMRCSHGRSKATGASGNEARSF